VTRVAIAAQDALGAFPTIPLTVTSADLIETAADATLKQSTVLTGRELIIAHNTGAGARTVTFTSVADERGRTGDITTYSIGAGKIAVFGPFTRAGWMQSGGLIYYEAEHAEVKFGVIRLPSIS
jgi:hypothetical protein